MVFSRASDRFRKYSAPGMPDVSREKVFLAMMPVESLAIKTAVWPGSDCSAMYV